MARPIDIEADGRIHGAFDTQQGAAGAANLVETVRSAVQRCHGAPGQAFVERLNRLAPARGRALPAAGPGDRSLALRLDQAVAGGRSLPPGCSDTHGLRLVKVLRGQQCPKSGMGR